jgi:hypothetical protein
MGWSNSLKVVGDTTMSRGLAATGSGAGAACDATTAALIFCHLVAL